MTNVNELYPSRYLSASDIGVGNQKTVVIKSQKTDVVGNDEKLVLELDGVGKEWVCGKNNAKEIAKTLGPETNDWVGNTITLGTAKFNTKEGLKDGIVVLAVEKDDYPVDGA